MLTRRQQKMARALYEGAQSETEFLEEHHVHAAVLKRWLDMPEFQEELQRLHEASLRETRSIITRYGPVAALKLATLLNAEKEDTARRAALDMIDRSLRIAGLAQEGDDNGNAADEGAPLSDDEVQRMLLTLAGGMEEQEER